MGIQTAVLEIKERPRAKTVKPAKPKPKRIGPYRYSKFERACVANYTDSV